MGQPQFQLTLNGKTITQPGSGKIEILSPAQLPVAEVTADSGVARTGPSTDYSRLTPLPKGTRATVTGKEGEWLRLDYGAWINSQGNPHSTRCSSTTDSNSQCRILVNSLERQKYFSPYKFLYL